MVGNRVRVILLDTHMCIEGVLKRIDPAGVTVYRESRLPEGRGNVFTPMHRVIEVVDLGRAP